MNNIMHRLKEPSSYAALAGVLAMVGVIAPVGAWQTIAMLACAASGVIGFVLGEDHHDHGKKK